MQANKLPLSGNSYKGPPRYGVEYQTVHLRFNAISHGIRSNRTLPFRLNAAESMSSDKVLAHKDGSKPDIPKGRRERAERNNIGMAVVCPGGRDLPLSGDRLGAGLYEACRSTSLKGWRVASIVEQLGSCTSLHPIHSAQFSASDFWLCCTNQGLRLSGRMTA